MTTTTRLASLEASALRRADNLTDDDLAARLVERVGDAAQGIASTHDLRELAAFALTTARRFEREQRASADADRARSDSADQGTQMRLRRTAERQDSSASRLARCGEAEWSRRAAGALWARVRAPNDSRIGIRFGHFAG